MSQFDDSSQSSDSEESFQITQKPLTYDISILRHLPEARRILQGQNYEHQITKCMYEVPLANNPNFLIPKQNSITPTSLQNGRLNRLEQAMFQHVNMKEKIKGLLGYAGISTNCKEYLGTLWSLYREQVPSYSRFGLNIRKSNFANVMMPINGVNIILGPNYYHNKVPPTNSLASHSNISSKLSPARHPDTVRFDSHFQCGNLLYAYRRHDEDIETYDLILQNDINTKGHNQWFYFKIHNSKNHNKIRLNIINFNKDQSMFSYGIKPLAFSERDYNRHRIGWIRSGQKINYYENKIKRQSASRDGNSRSYYTLSFEYYFREVDAVYFAPSHPYTHTQLLAFYDNIMMDKSLTNVVSLKMLGETVGRNIVSVLTIGSGKKQLKDCKIVWIFGRQHPGQVTASYMAEGIIQYLISLYTAPPQGIESLLNGIVFKIVPMINVDGAIHGNTRAQLTGVDPNRMWKKPLKRLAPIISGLKKMIGCNRQNVSLVLDLHSHSKKLGCFFYGNSLIYDPKFTKIYPTMVCEGDERFQLKNCRFRGGYQTTARSVLFHQLSIPSVYTVECSLLGYMKNKRIQQYQISDYSQMGRRLVDCYINLQKSKMTKKQQQIVEELGDKIPLREDADSARSESSLSDDQYEEIRMKIKNKKNRMKAAKKTRKCANENSNNIASNQAQKGKKQQVPKYYIKRNIRTNTKIDVLKENKNSTSKQSAADLPNLNKLRIKNNKNQTFSMLRENQPPTDSKLQKKKANQNQNKTLQHARQPRKQSNAENRIKTGAEEIKQFPIETKEIDVQASLDDSDSNTRYKKIKKQKNELLCVVGSSLEDDFVCAYKNDVSTQVFQDVIKEAFSQQHRNTNSQMNKRSMKNAKKVPKLLNYICSNLIGVPRQNSVLPQDRKFLAPIEQKRHINKL